MKDLSYIFRTYWLIVPEFVYIILLFGSWIVIISSVCMIIRCIIHKAEKNHYIKWLIVLMVAVIITVLAMTGKIVPHAALGG